MNPLIFILLAIAVFFVFKIKKSNKKKREDALVTSYNHNKRIPYPKKKHADGSKKTEQEYKDDMNLYFEKLSVNGKAYAKVEKIKQTRAGITHYIWRSSGDGDVCSDCKKNNGKKFSWDRPPKTGHPGEGTCCPNGHCRCYPEAKI